jgi:Mg-chelatase subunit ChlD
MAKIAISNLRPAGAELFVDSESYLNELTDAEMNMTHGGSSPFCAGVVLGIAISKRYC